MACSVNGPRPCERSELSFWNKLSRFLWNSVYAISFRFTPRTFHSWRAALLRCFGARIGKGCHIYPKVRIWAPWNLVMEDFSCLADDVDCYSVAGIVIGEKAVVSQGARLFTGTHDYEDPAFPLVTGPIRIGRLAWVAAEAFILPGVSIGEGAVVGARSVVTKDIPAWTVAAGNPCRPIKPRVYKKEA